MHAHAWSHALRVAVLFALLSSPATAQVTKTELAGNSLSQYPFFEYVRAFNVDAPVKVAIDAGRFPAIVGDVCDVYVVDHKSDWATNPALVDVTPGGALTRTFVAGTSRPTRSRCSGLHAERQCRFRTRRRLRRRHRPRPGRPLERRRLHRRHGQRGRPLRGARHHGARSAPGHRGGLQPRRHLRRGLRHSGQQAGPGSLLPHQCGLDGQAADRDRQPRQRPRFPLVRPHRQPPRLLRLRGHEPRQQHRARLDQRGGHHPGPHRRVHRHGRGRDDRRRGAGRPRRRAAHRVDRPQPRRRGSGHRLRPPVRRHAHADQLQSLGRAPDQQHAAHRLQRHRRRQPARRQLPPVDRGRRLRRARRGLSAQGADVPPARQGHRLPPVDRRAGCGARLVPFRHGRRRLQRAVLDRRGTTPTSSSSATCCRSSSTTWRATSRRSTSSRGSTSPSVRSACPRATPASSSRTSIATVPPSGTSSSTTTRPRPRPT